MLALFPEGFEESERGAELVLSAYTDARGEGRMAASFGEVTATDVPTDWVERWKRFHRPVSREARIPSSSIPAARSEPARIPPLGCAWTSLASSSPDRCWTSAAAPAFSRSRPRSSASRQ